MFKKTSLCFIFFCLFLLIPGCKETPTAPSILELTLPMIEYFTASPASIILGGSSTLSWNTTGATSISINQGIGVVSAAGTMDVYPNVTTGYTLIAQNSDGRRSQSCTIEIIKWAVLEYSTLPTSPVFIYDPIADETTSNFVIVLTEIAGVGGQIDRILLGPCPDISSQELAGGMFDAFGNFSCCCVMALSGKPVCIRVNWQGIDDNGYAIDKATWITISWIASKGSISSLETVEGETHHKLIR